MKVFMSLWVALVMTFVSFVPGFVPPETKNTTKTYPFVFVHGFLGWGEDEGIDDDLAYWGATACNLMGEMRKKGFDCYAASVGPFSSNWDRACELYAQLTGTRVDYGEAHSKEHNHLRYGRTYEKPLIKDWGGKDSKGLYNKVNLIGHSFGGNTVRLLESLLSDGDADERAVSGKGDISPLFVGGKSDWINAVVTICSPNNGTTLKYIVEDLNMVGAAEYLLYGYAGVMGRSPVNGYVDFHLEQFGLTKIPGEGGTDVSIHDAIECILQQPYDSVEYDLSIEGVQNMNNRIDVNKNVYYFSYAFQTTAADVITKKHQLPKPNTLAILIPFATLMGSYSTNKNTDYQLDDTWLANDGLVNVKSALYPFNEAHKDYDSASVETGIWNVMPLSSGDHGNAIGIGVSKRSIVKFYKNMLDMIDNLPVVS